MNLDYEIETELLSEMPKEVEMTKENEGEMPIEELKAELEKAREALKTANAESAGRRKKLEAYEAEADAKARDAMTDAQKMQAAIEAEKTARLAIETELQTIRIRAAVVEKASELGFASVEDAFALIDIGKVQIIEGKVTGFEKQLEELAKSGRLQMKDASSIRIGTPGRQSQLMGTTKTPAKEPVKIRL